MSDTTTKPTLELKNLKLAKFASEETPCYEATLYVDGERIAHLHNQGHGGGDHVRFLKTGFTQDDWNALEQRVAETYPKIVFEGHPPIDTNIECECHGMVWDHDERKDLQRQLRGNVLTMEERKGKKGIWEYRGKDWSDPRVKLLFQKQRPGAIVLNALAFDEAFTLWKEVIRGS